MLYCAHGYYWCGAAHYKWTFHFHFSEVEDSETVNKIKQNIEIFLKKISLYSKSKLHEQYGLIHLRRLETAENDKPLRKSG